MKAQGFTLIELVVVIVILGILAATVAPKYIDLEAEAHTATLQALKASMEGGSALVYGKAIVKGNHKEKFTFLNIPTIELADGSLTINYGHPLAQKTTWDRLIDYSTDKYDAKKTTDGATLMFYVIKNGEPINAAADCIVHYTQPTEAGAKPTITVNPCV